MVVVVVVVMSKQIDFDLRLAARSARAAAPLKNRLKNLFHAARRRTFQGALEVSMRFCSRLRYKTRLISSGGPNPAALTAPASGRGARYKSFGGSDEDCLV